MKQSKAAILVLLAGALWGSMGVFVRRLNAAGLYAMDVVLARMLSALLFMGVFMLLFARESFRIRLKDLWCFLGSGIVSLLLFSLCYFSGMQVTSLNVMAVLLYTSPAIIMILSIILFHEKLTKRKLLALIMTFAGCCLVSGIGSESAVSMQGLLLGLGAGFFYALYSIFSRFVTAFLAFGFYTKGLEGMESSRAGILASTEPVVATLFGVFVFQEHLTLPAIVGILLVLGGIVVLSGKKAAKA